MKLSFGRGKKKPAPPPALDLAARYRPKCGMRQGV
jgi:hypothetical protein